MCPQGEEPSVQSALDIYHVLTESNTDLRQPVPPIISWPAVVLLQHPLTAVNYQSGSLCHSLCHTHSTAAAAGLAVGSAALRLLLWSDCTCSLHTIKRDVRPDQCYQGSRALELAHSFSKAPHWSVAPCTYPIHHKGRIEGVRQ